MDVAGDGGGTAGSRPSASSDGRARVQSIRRACALLASLQSAAPQSTVDLARATGLNRTIVHRLMRTLADEGLVHQNGSDYSLGARTLGLGHAYLDHLRLRAAALPYATALHAVVKDRAQFIGIAAPAWDSVVIVDEIWNPTSPLDIVVRVGTRLPVLESAAGRCLLAYAPVAGLDPSLEAGADLVGRLDAIRARGGVEFASAVGEPMLDLIAAVILGQGGRPGGVIAVAGPGLSDQYTEDSEITTHLRRAASMIGQTIA